MTHVTPTTPSSGVSGSFQLSPLKSCAPSVDHANVHGLPSAEKRRDSFPPYVISSSKRSTAVVAPSLARSRHSPLPTATSVAQSATVSPIRFPSASLSTNQRWLSARPSQYTPRSTQSLPKVMSDLGRRCADSAPVCRSTGARSLLAPSSAASSGISYSLALSTASSSVIPPYCLALPSTSNSGNPYSLARLSASSSGTPYRLTLPSISNSGSPYSLARSPASSSGNPYCLALSLARTSSSHSSADQPNRLQLSLSRHTHSHPVSSSSNNPERTDASLRAYSDAYADRGTGREPSRMYNYPAPQRRTPLTITSIGRPANESPQSLTRAENLARYQPYLGLNQTSRPATTQYTPGPFASSSVPRASSQLHSLQTPPNSGRFTEIRLTAFGDMFVPCE